MSGPPAPTPSKIEERHDSLGARRTWGVWGAMSGPPAPTPSKIEERHDSLGARRTWGGVGGHVGAPRTDAEQNRGAPRFTRGATHGGGGGGPRRGPPPRRRGNAGARSRRPRP